MSTVSNKPQHGDTLLDREKLAANGPFQEFLDDLVDQVDANVDDLSALTTRVDDLTTRMDALEARVATLETDIVRRVEEGYGGISLSTPAGLSNITGGSWQELPADTALLSNPVDIIQNPGSNSLEFERAGVERITVQATLSFSDSNQGRTFNIRLLDKTQSVVLRTIPVFVGRNTAGANISISALAEISAEAAGLDSQFVMEIGDASATFTGVTLESYVFAANYVSGAPLSATGS